MTSTPTHWARLAALGWAAFVACSWTWCIGMFLPVLLVRDFGLLGWVAFAVPNVIGAAAMGWVLQRPGSAAELSRRHWPAAVAFSVVTILFHAFFAAWLIRALAGDGAMLAVPLLAWGFYFFGRRGDRDLLAAAGVLALSLIAFGLFAAMAHEGIPGPQEVRGTAPLAWLAPVCIFGFLLCPYLDLTFLRARASTAPREGIAAFTLGFGVLFLVMILFTLGYARLLDPSRLDLLPRPLAWIIATHLVVQSSFTVALHTRAIAEHPAARRAAGVNFFFAGVILAAAVGLACHDRQAFGHSAGEIVYRLFLAFYGLVFPTYVWLCVIPPPGRPSPATGPLRPPLAATVVVVLVAAPMFWMGFIANQMEWLGIGVAIVLASRWVLPALRPAAVRSAAAPAKPQ